MKEMINILFLGGAKRLSLAERFIKSGNELNVSVKIFSYELSADVPITEVAEIIIGRKWKDNDLYEHLKSVIDQKQIHMVLPFVDQAIAVCAKLKDLIKNIYIPVSDLKICEIMFDKILSDEWFRKNNLPLPDFDGTLPAIAKPRLGSASKGLVVFSSLEELDEFNAMEAKDDFLLQKFIDAKEYTVDCFVSKRNEIIGILPRERIEVVNGEVTKSITVYDEEIVNKTKLILYSGSFRGPITVQFLKNRDNGELYVMEVNPRFGGGVINSIEAGLDIPLLILKESMNIPISKVDKWKENLLMLRVNREVFICK